MGDLIERVASAVREAAGETMLEHFDLSFLRRVLWEGIIGRVKDGRFAKPDR